MGVFVVRNLFSRSRRPAKAGREEARLARRLAPPAAGPQLGVPSCQVSNTGNPRSAGSPARTGIPGSSTCFLPSAAAGASCLGGFLVVVLAPNGLQPLMDGKTGDRQAGERVRPPPAQSGVEDQPRQ